MTLNPECKYLNCIIRNSYIKARSSTLKFRSTLNLIQNTLVLIPGITVQVHYSQVDGRIEISFAHFSGNCVTAL
jgi:hypothetical protein